MPFDLFNFQNEASTGQMIMLAPVGESEVRSNQSRGTQPKSRIFDLWQWIFGPAPRISVANGTAAADGSEVVVHALKNGQGAIVGWRYIVLQTSGSGYLIDSSDTVLQTLAAGQYADLLVNTANEITGSTSPATFNRNTTTGSVGIMNAIDAARSEMAVPESLSNES